MTSPLTISLDAAIAATFSSPKSRLNEARSSVRQRTASFAVTFAVRGTFRINEISPVAVVTAV